MKRLANLIRNMVEIISGKNIVKHEIYIGLTHKNGVCILDRAIVVAEIAKHIGDCSIIDQTGIYKGVPEDSLYITVFSEKRDFARLAKAAAVLCKVLYQNEIIVDGAFISAEEK